MVEISYSFVMTLISVFWVMGRIVCNLRSRSFSLKRELELILVYICVIVVTRFTFFPFSKVDGQVQPLLFDWEKLFPPRINLLPVVYLFDYPVFREAILNLVGNTAMFIPLGIVWPSVFRQLDTHKKAIASGVLTSLAIEIMQLPFYDRVSDIDDLILNSLGFLAGYGIYVLVKKCHKKTSA